MNVVNPSTEIHQPTLENDDTDETFSFSTALDALKDGNRATREVWDSHDIFIELQEPDENSKMTSSYIYKTDAFDVFPYTLTNEDLLADDWIIL